MYVKGLFMFFSFNFRHKSAGPSPKAKDIHIYARMCSVGKKYTFRSLR